MSLNTVTASPSESGIAAFRRWLLRIHGVALGSAVATTIG